MIEIISSEISILSYPITFCVYSVASHSLSVTLADRVTLLLVVILAGHLPISVV